MRFPKVELYKSYLIKVGLPKVWVNSSGKKHPFPILMGEIFIGDDKPTLLFYAHFHLLETYDFLYLLL